MVKTLPSKTRELRFHILHGQKKQNIKKRNGTVTNSTKTLKKWSTSNQSLPKKKKKRAIVFSDGDMIGDDVVYKILSNDEIISKASLKKTSLVSIAQKCGIDPEKYIHHFIECEKEERDNG